MRPASIIWFERAVVLLIVLSIANVCLIWDELVAETNGAGGGPVLVIVTQGISFGLYALLAWLTSRRASNIAKWLYVGVNALGFIGLADMSGVVASGAILLALIIAEYGLSAISIGLLFRRDARDWFAGRRPVDPDIFA